MSSPLPDKELHDCLERISGQGCEAVNRLLSAHEQGHPIPEISHLSADQQHQVITELRKVMNVYTSCGEDS